jgi:hypothetical protein
MTVAELIVFLQAQPQDLPVCYGMYSEFLLLDAAEVEVQELGLPRPDGWVANQRRDQPSQKYLVFPGN